MEVIGIIAEYNPFHNGHLYHINKIKELYPDSLIILVLNGFFLQRGEISTLTKEDKTKIALLNNVDLVLELPLLYGCQSADIFAEASLKILNEFKINKLIFGSEINDSQILYDIAKKQLDPKFDEKVKEYIKKGLNYPTALSKALNQNFEYLPNDLLGISYTKAIIKNNYDIQIETIKRTNNYHDLTLDQDIVSASNIREKIKNNLDITKYLPKESYEKIINTQNDNLFKLLKYKILIDNQLNNILDVNEGLDFLIKSKIDTTNNIDQLIKEIKSKRYTYNRINRMLIHILLNITKEDATETLKYITILGFNKKGKIYLNSIKKEINIPLKKDFNSKQYEYEINASKIYDLINNTNTYDFEKRNKPISIE